MGRQRNNPQTKGKEKSSERVLNEMEASNLSDTVFKIMVIKMFGSSVGTIKKSVEATSNLLGTTSA